MSKLDKQLLEELEQFEKACGGDDETPATRKAKEAEEPKPKDKKHAEPDGDENLLKGEDEEEDEPDGDEVPEGKEAARKSILDELADAEADLDPDFDPEILKALDAIGEPDDGFNSGELLKAVSQQVTAQMAILGGRVEELTAENAEIKKSLFRMVKAFRKSQNLLGTIADSPTGRKSARTSGVTAAQFAKAQEANSQTWDNFLKAADVAMSKREIDARQVAQLENCFNKGMPVIDAMNAMPTLFKSLSAHLAASN